MSHEAVLQKVLHRWLGGRLVDTLPERHHDEVVRRLELDNHCGQGVVFRRRVNGLHRGQRSQRCRRFESKASDNLGDVVNGLKEFFVDFAEEFVVLRKVGADYIPMRGVRFVVGKEGLCEQGAKRGD